MFKSIFKKYDLYEGRMISPSKSAYINLFPYNKISFDSFVCIKKNGIFKRIWWGDLDINEDGKVLKLISEEIAETLYIFHKSVDLIKENVFWETTQEIPIVTEEYIKNKKEQKAKEELQERINFIKKMRKAIKENKTYSKEDLLKTLYHQKIDLPLDYISNKIKEFEEDFKNIKNPSNTEGFLHDKYFKEYGYFTYFVLESYLQEKFNIKEGMIINPSSVWMSRNTNKFLRKIDLKIEQMFNKDFNYADFGRYVTCNYCVPNIRFSNGDGLNLKSYEDNMLYLREDLSKEYIKFK